MKESLYKRIARELVQSIASGKYPVGTLLPPEMELCEQFDVSRHTIREALRDITEQGLIVRRKGLAL
ncbi:HTH-type transcriptional regulator frlR [Serratia fonticola]|uniref:HTH-type transcriptional regulator frlR n=1 Tax=Serratia fonticola TaxID=47917 RepID=A0A4U9WP49_SERFO|nr:HTH-type transcriptional regulator frlR [Serratia fonticola]